MPNLDATLSFIAAGERLEVRVVAAATRAWHRARLELLGALAESQSVAPIVAWVGHEVASALAELSPRAAELLARYLSTQLASVPDAPPAAPIEPQLATALPAWQAATVGRFLSSAQQLAGDSPAAIAAALASPTGTPGVSAFVWGLNSLQLASEAALWQGLNGALKQAYEGLNAPGRPRFQKQAIAAIDRRTTQCCLQVHGQIRELNEAFTTDGAPAFAGQQQSPPFHHRCRTVIALYHPAMESVGPSTAELRASARAELAERR